MAKFKLTPVQAYRLIQAQDTLHDIAAELNPNGQVKGDAKFATIYLTTAAANITEAMQIAEAQASPKPPAPLP